MKAVAIILAVLGLALIFLARRKEMPAVRANFRLMGGAMMAIALGFAAYDAMEG